MESEPDELPQACVGTVSHSLACDKTSQNSSIDSHVKVVDHPELRPRLLNLLNKYREVIALPGEPLGTTYRQNGAPHLANARHSANLHPCLSTYT